MIKGQFSVEFRINLNLESTHNSLSERRTTSSLADLNSKLNRQTVSEKRRKIRMYRKDWFSF